jgi:DegV family protein with EDD domain
MGQGLMVKYATEKKNEGLSIEETANWLEEHKQNFVALFTVDDLFFLKRGGRLSGTVAVVGTILGIKPMLHVSDEGKLVNTDKVRGRGKSIDALVTRMGELGVDLKNQEIFISHGDCIEDAELLADKIRKEFKVKNIVINFVDQVIGSHSGPGTLALFFMGKER